MKKNNKGFTLIELMAVAIILITILLIGLFATNKYIERSRTNAFISEANTISKGALEKFALDKSDKDFSDDLFSSNVEGRRCYSIENSIIGKTVEKLENKGYEGSVEVCTGEDCTYATKIWIKYKDYYIDGVEGDIKKSDLKTSISTQNYLTCGVTMMSGGSSCDADSCEFEYNGKGYKFTAPVAGTYVLEAWGAQGGYFKRSPYTVGGYGGYAYGEIELEQGDTLYIQVGGKGNDSDGTGGHKGYNGGGAEYIYTNSNYPDRSAGGGGGATSFAFKEGRLTEIASRKDYIVMIAGGGGGGSLQHMPGSGGGYTGGLNDEDVTFATSSTYYNLGQGRPAYQNGCGVVTGGGGSGFYGGTTQSRCTVYGTSGGSGYIAYPNLTNKYMYGYHVQTSDDVNTKTYNTTEISDEPIQNYAKRGDGYARITYLD